MATNDRGFREQLGKFRLESTSETASRATVDGPRARSKRVATACELCRRRKKKCDFRYPNCSACERAGVRCAVLEPVASAAVPRDQLETLQKRVEWLEEALQRCTGLDVSSIPTGSPIDGESLGWYRVPDLMLSAGRAGRSLDRLASSAGEIFRDQLENRRPAAARPPAPPSPPRAVRLSSLAAAETLAAEYFDSLGLQYPFLLRGQFMDALRRIYAGAPVSPDALCCYHITLATAMHIGASDGSMSASLYQAARETLPLALQNEDVPALRCLLGLALYAMFAPSGPSVWHVLGSAIRLATSLGLHRARPSFPDGQHRQQQLLVEDEMAKRAFWSLYNLDRLTAVTLSRPLGIADDDITVDLPGEYDDNWVLVPGACSMTIPVQVIRLRRIFSRIYRALYSNRPRSPDEDINRTLRGFRHELDAWRTSAPLLPAALHYSTSYFDYLYHTALLLLYRPSPLHPTPDAPCVVACGDSSVQVVRSYWDSYALGKIKWIWLTLCQIYAAGTTMLWCIDQNVRARREGRPLVWTPPEHVVRYGVDAVVVLLEEFGKRRRGVERLASAFQQQSAAVLDMAAQEGASPPPAVDDNRDAVVDPTLPEIDPQVVEQLLYSYDWFQEELAMFYTL